jgi:hypothetical protein
MPSHKILLAIGVCWMIISLTFSIITGESLKGDTVWQTGTILFGFGLAGYIDSFNKKI